MKTTTQWENQHGETVATWTGAIDAREQKVVELQRKKALAELTRERAKADCKQRSAKSKQKKRGGGVRESMGKSKLIADNKEKWLAMCKTHNNKQENQEDTREGDNAGDTQGKNDKDNGEDHGSNTLLGQQQHSSTTHKPVPTKKHHGGAMEAEREGGGKGGKGPPSRVRDRTSKEGKHRIAKGRGSSIQERKMEEYYTRKPRKKKRKNENL